MGFAPNSQFLSNYASAQRSVNEPILLTKVGERDLTIQQFLDIHSTQIAVFHSKIFKDAIELVSIDTKKNGMIFITLRNRSNQSIKVPSNAFVNPALRINGEIRYLLNGLKRKEDFFKFEKEYYPTKKGSKVLKSIKDDLETLEQQLPKQNSAQDNIVDKRLNLESDLIFLQPYEIATFEINI